MASYCDFTTSVYDGLSNLYACGYSVPGLYRINVDTKQVTAVSISGKVGNVFSLLMWSNLAQNSNLYVVGDSQYLAFDTFKSAFTQTNISSAPVVIFKNSKFPVSTGAEVYQYAELSTASTMNLYSMYSRSGTTLTLSNLVGTINVYSLVATGLSVFSPTQYSLTSTLGLAFGNYCANVQVSNTNYLVPSTARFNFASMPVGSQAPTSFVTLPVSQGYTGAAYDGRYIYMVPASGYRNMVRFDTSKKFSMFVPFCTDTSVDPSGELNFSRVSMQIPGVTSGTVYAVNHNILRFRSGMASILYAS